MQKAREVLQKYIPEAAVEPVINILFSYKELHLKITKSRSSKFGDYRKIAPYKHQISVNYNLNKYQFLITLLHEIAHFLTYKQFGHKIKPHGKEWKQTFGKLLQNFIHPNIFPDDLIPDLQAYARNPKASTAGDGNLYLKLSKHNEKSGTQTKYVFELVPGQIFTLPNGVVYQLQEKRRTRYKCLRISNQKVYLIHQNAEVYPINPDDL